MNSFNASPKKLLVFNELLNDLPSLKKHVEYYKNSVGLVDVWHTRQLEVLIIKPYFPSYSLHVNSISDLSECYETQAEQLAHFLHLELGINYQKIHIESGSVEKLVKKYIQKYQIEKVIFDLVPFKENYFSNTVKMNRDDHVENSINALKFLY